MGFSTFPNHTAGLVNQDPPVVGIWSNACGSSNITITMPGCGPLAVGSTISVQVNLTNAPAGTVDAYDFFLYYDPTYINATGFDATMGTVFSNPITISNFLPRGTVRLSGACEACTNNSPNGALININFKILALGVSPLTLAQGFAQQKSGQQSFTVLVTPAGVGIGPVTEDGYFKNEPVKLGPVAGFTFSPLPVLQRQQVMFDASASYDPDASTGAANRGISLYMWDFGGVTSLSASVGSPTYSIKLGSSIGNFSVRLTVVDTDNNFQGMQTQLFTVSQLPSHDLVARITTAVPTANPGDKVTVTATVANNGTFPENFSLNVTSPTTVIRTETNQRILVATSTPFPFTLDTTGFAPGFYTLTAKVTVLPSTNNTNAIDNIPTNNVDMVTLRIEAPSTSTSPLLLLAGGVVAAVVVLAVVGLLLRKRRQASES